MVAPDGDGYWTDVADRIETPEDADLIAHAPEDLAALVAENRRLRAVAEAADRLSIKVVTDPGWPRLRAALDALNAGGGE